MSSYRAAARLTTLVLAGCGDPGAAVTPNAPVTPDATVIPDADAAPCSAPDDCDWLEAYQRDIVGRLSGERPIVEGVTLAARGTVGSRRARRCRRHAPAAGPAPRQHTPRAATSPR